MDVLTSHLLSVQLDDHRDCAVRLAEHLGVERHRLAKKLRRDIAARGPALRKELKKCARDFERLRSPDSQPDPPQAAAATALQLSSELGSPATLNRANLHPYRLKVKELRYVLQTAQDGGDHRFADVLGASKDAIGEWHDWEELIAIAEGLLDDSASCPVVKKLKEISSRKFDAALDSTLKMRREFAARPNARGARRAKPGTIPARSAMEAVAAIAS